MTRDYTGNREGGCGTNPEEFWRFSLRLYAAEGVEAACLALQDRHGLDVNLLLLACWAGATGRGALDADDCRDLAAQVQSWQGRVVRELRAVRRVLKGMDGGAEVTALRKAVAACELDAERLEQQMLARALAGRAPREENGGQRRDAIAAGLAACLRAAPVPAGEADRAPLAVLLQACVPAIGSAEALAALAAADSPPEASPQGR